jgi:hypothetical protein
MRLDRILTEGEAVNALQKLGFTVREAPNRTSQYIVAHPQIGGERTFTIEQLTAFTEGAVVISTHLASGAAVVKTGA